MEAVCRKARIEGARILEAMTDDEGMTTIKGCGWLEEIALNECEFGVACSTVLEKRQIVLGADRSI